MKRHVSFTSRVACKDGTVIDVLVIFFGCASIDIGTITETIQDELKTKETIPDCIAILSIEKYADELLRSWKENEGRTDVLKARGSSGLIHYLKGVTIWKFSKGKFERLFADSKLGKKCEFDVLEIMRDGLGHLVESHGAYQVAPSGHVFKHPSGKLSKQFFLASEVVKNEIDAYYIALCICAMAWSNLIRINRLYIDTMGIYPIAHAMSEICHGDTGPTFKRWEIISFHSHAGMPSVHQVSGTQQFVLISASTSGNMALAFREKGFPADAIATILDVSDEGRVGLVIYNHDKYIKNVYGSHSGVGKPSEGESAIELTGEYFAATGKRPRPLTLTIDHGPKHLKSFLKAFSKQGLCCIHRPRNGASKVDILSVNEDAIVSNKDFSDWLVDELRLRTPISVSHILPVNNAAAVKLAAICAEKLSSYRGSAPKIVSRNEMESLRSKKVTGVLVCAPLVGNGHELRVASRDLRELNPEASRHFLMGVGLPETEESWTRLKQFLAQSGDPLRPYAVSEWLHLPIGVLDRETNVWRCAERLMQRTEHEPCVPFNGLQKKAVEKSLRLAGNALEAARKTFLHSTSDQPMKLTRGFVYWDPKKNDVIEEADKIATSFMAMSSALQVAREFNVPVKRLSSSLHETVVLDPENFLRFNDSALQASILRAANAYELDYSYNPELSLIMREFLEKVFKNHDKPYGDAALEFALALATGHLRLTKNDMEKLVDSLKPLLKAPSALFGFIYIIWRNLNFV